MSDSSKWLQLQHAVPHLTEAMALEFCSRDPQRDICVVLKGSDERDGETLSGTRISGSADGAREESSVSPRPKAQGPGLARKAPETVFAVAKEMATQKFGGLSTGATSPYCSFPKVWAFIFGETPKTQN